MVGTILWFPCLLTFFSLWMCSFDLIISLSVQVNSVASGLFWNVLPMFCHVEYKMVLYYFTQTLFFLHLLE